MLRNIGMMQKFAHRQMGIHQLHVLKHMERLSTGKRINRAADDPAGLAISERMRGQIRGIQQAQRNVRDGISLLRTAEGGLNEQHAILQRMRELAVQSANDTNSLTDRVSLQLEMDQLLKGIVTFRDGTEFNTRPLYQGGKIRLQTGANAGQSIEIKLPDTDLAELGIDDLDLSTKSGVNIAIGRLDGAIQKVSSSRSMLGAYENRLEHTYSSLTNGQIQLTNAESRIRDANMAKEIMGLLKHQMLQEVSMVMFIQINEHKSMIFRLLNNKR